MCNEMASFHTCEVLVWISNSFLIGFSFVFS